MDYLDSSYIWGVNSLNGGNLSSRQQAGLAALAPQSGLGLTPAPARTNLGIGEKLPSPQFTEDARKYFSGFTEPQINEQEMYFLSGGRVGTPSLDYANAPDQNFTPQEGKTPYFDPNYPIQSLVALREKLVPEIEAGASESMKNRGLAYSGVGKYAGESALGYLNQQLPNFTPNQAQTIDFARIYGGGIANSMLSGGYAKFPWYGGKNQGSGIFQVPPTLPSSGASVIPEGSGEYQAALLRNYQIPSGKTGQDVGAPEFGLVDLNTNMMYSGPGYFYNPYNIPDTSKMPWLANATSPTSETSKTS